MSEHTPIPWEVKSIGHNIYIETVSMKPDGGFICDLQADEHDTPEERSRIQATAEFIVRACHSHDDLLAACIQALETIRWYKENGLSGQDYNIHELEGAIANAKA